MTGTTTLRGLALVAYRRRQAEQARYEADREAEDRERGEARLRDLVQACLAGWLPDGWDKPGWLVWVDGPGEPLPTFSVDGITLSPAYDSGYDLTATARRACEHRVSGTIKPGSALENLGDLLERAAAPKCPDCEFEAREREGTADDPGRMLTPGEKLLEALAEFVTVERQPY